MKIKKNISIFVFIVLIISFSLNSCGMNNLSDEDEFINEIEKIEFTDHPLYIMVDDIHDMITTTKPNLIIKCKVNKRYETGVYDPLKKYSSNDLLSKDTNTASTAYAYLSTPYELEILEVYLGDINNSGDKIILKAPYGVYENIETRKSYHPILKVGEEYIMFLRVDMIFGELTYYTAYTPASILIVDSVNGTFSLPETNQEWNDLYKIYDNKIENLVIDLKQMIEKNNYDVSIEYAGESYINSN